MISVIIVNYNTWNLTEKLCHQILEHHHIQHMELVVVDNNSKSNAPSLLAENSHITLVLNTKNKGFAGGVNDGVKAAKNKYVVVLNSDISLPEQKPFFQPLVKRLEQSGVGACSPKIVYSRDGVIQFAGFTPINPFTGRGFAIGHGHKDQGQYDTPKEIPRCHGAAMAFTKSVWQETHGIFEGYFLYYEEMDFSAEIQKLGYTIWYEPSVTAYHYGSFSITENSTPKWYYITRNRIWYLRRQTAITHQCISLPYLLCTGLFKGLLHLIKGESTKAAHILKGTIHGLFKNIHG